MTGAAKNTVVKLLCELGAVCSAYQDETLRGIKCKRIQADEIWAFCYAKAKHVPADKQGQYGYGDIWTWTALDADTKLMVSWFVGDRSELAARLFMLDLAERITGSFQLTTDGLFHYIKAVEVAFGGEIDFAQLRKIYGKEQNEVRYSPPVVLGVKTSKRSGDPDPAHISTSYVERANLTLRMGNRRFTRLTNGFSKKAENHEHAVALHFMYYNFCRVHTTLKTTPAVAAGVADHVWKIEEIIALLEKS
jgi:IS1 family transposase